MAAENEENEQSLTCYRQVRIDSQQSEIQQRETPEFSSSFIIGIWSKWVCLKLNNWFSSVKKKDAFGSKTAENFLNSKILFQKLINF